MRAEFERASVAPPPGAADQSVVFGRVVDAAGRPVHGVKVAAVDASGAQLASATVRAQGAFELRVPITKPGKVRTNDQAHAEQPTGHFRLHGFGANERVVFQGDEDFDAVGHRVSYRDIIVPHSVGVKP